MMRQNMTDATECKWSYHRDGSHREFILPGPFSKAKGKKVCQDCCRFLGWHELHEEKPAYAPASPVSDVTPEDRDLIHLLQSEKLPDWETKFVHDLSRKNAWTEKQRAVFDRVRKKYLKTPDPQPKEEKHEPTVSAVPTLGADDFYVPF